MAGNETEQKNRPPTAARLKRLRNKEGQVARSTDFPTALTLVALCGLLIFQASSIFAHFEGAFALITETVVNPVMVSAPTQILRLLKSITIVVWPFMAVAAFMHIFFSALSTKGIVISGKNISPKFDRLNPANGIKKIFGIQSLSQFLKTVVKVIFVGAALYWIFVTFVNSIFWAPPCGVSCILKSYRQVIGYTVFTILLISVIVAIVDIRIAGALFRKQNKMSDSEIKREYIEDNGSPEIRRERNRLRNDANESDEDVYNEKDSLQPSVESELDKDIFYVHSMSVAVGLEYIRGSRKVPILVSVMPLIDHDQEGTRYVLAPLLADDIAKTIAFGQPVASRHFSTIAKIMTQLDVK